MDDATEQTPDNALPLPELVAVRLAGDRKLMDPVKTLIREALGDSETSAAGGARASAGRVYLGKVTVTGFRGVGSEAQLNLRPKPGVTLVVGRNGSGKSSIAEAVETLFTATNAHCSGQHPNRAVRWRNLHHDEPTRVEAKLVVEGDPSPGTLTRTWTGDAFTGSEAVLKRSGHGTVPLEQAGWEQATRNHRPFLSYADLGNMINGKPSQMYDSIAGILGLEYLNAASRRLTEQRKELEAVEKAEKEKKSLLLAALIAGVPTADEGSLREARLEADAKGPDLDRSARPSTPCSGPWPTPTT